MGKFKILWLLFTAAAAIAFLIACSDGRPPTGGGHAGHDCPPNWSNWTRPPANTQGDDPVFFFYTTRVCIDCGYIQTHRYSTDVAGVTDSRRYNSQHLGTMLYIPAGSFYMGSPDSAAAGEPGFASLAIERPVRRVTLTRSFYMSRTPVTRAQWRAVRALSNYVHNATFAPPDGEAENNHPAINISFFDMLVFANEASRISGLQPVYEIPHVDGSGTFTYNVADWGAVPTGPAHANHARWNEVQMRPGANGYRLPTEAEWEFAARAGTTTDFNDGITNWQNIPAVHAAIAELAVFGLSTGQRQPVGTKQPNAWGLLDMHGNVWERVWDLLGTTQYSGTVDPQGWQVGEPGQGSLTNRVQRGGGHHVGISGHGTPLYLRSAHRNYTHSGLPHLRHNCCNGFRLVRSIIN